MMLQALAIERAAATRTAERVLHHRIAQYQLKADLVNAEQVAAIVRSAGAAPYLPIDRTLDDHALLKTMACESAFISAGKIPFPGNRDFGSKRPGSTVRLLSRKSEQLMLGNILPASRQGESLPNGAVPHHARGQSPAPSGLCG
jgi:hypothetical protein